MLSMHPCIHASEGCKGCRFCAKQRKQRMQSMPRLRTCCSKPHPLQPTCYGSATEGNAAQQVILQSTVVRRSQQPKVTLLSLQSIVAPQPKVTLLSLQSTEPASFAFFALHRTCILCFLCFAQNLHPLHPSDAWMHVTLPRVGCEAKHGCMLPSDAKQSMESIPDVKQSQHVVTLRFLLRSGSIW